MMGSVRESLIRLSKSGINLSYLLTVWLMVEIKGGVSIISLDKKELDVSGISSHDAKLNLCRSV